MTTVSIPYGFAREGSTATATGDAGIRMLIEQILFTMPGERVNRPSFGSLITGLVFAGNSDLVAATAQATAHSALQRFLGDRISIEGVDVSAEDATLTVMVTYSVRDSGERVTATFDRPLP